MKLTKPLILLVPVAAIIGAVVWRWSRPVGNQPITGGSPSMTSNQPSVQLAKTKGSDSMNPQFGIASLSEAEKKILHDPFPDRSGRAQYDRVAYEVGIICLKHRLSYDEVVELIKSPRSPPNPVRPSDTVIGASYVYGFSQALGFMFDRKGKLKAVEGDSGGMYKLPPLESVTHDTPLEPEQRKP